MLRIVVLFMLVMVAHGGFAAGQINYAGSSTIGKFILDASHLYPGVVFNVRTLAESAYGRRCVQEGRCDIGGVASEVDLAQMPAGVEKVLIGYDLVAVVVNRQNPVAQISRENLAAIFSGKITNWSELGGPVLPITPYMVKPASATHQVFKQAVMDGSPFSSRVNIIPFDAKMTAQVGADRGGIGVISLAFAWGSRVVDILAVDSHVPDLEDRAYPIRRPLYLLLPAEQTPEVKRFVEWVIDDAGQAVVGLHFIGR